MTPEQQQRSIRERTVDAIDGMTAENPAVTIEMADIYQSASSVGEVKLDEEVVHEISFMENPMEVEKNLFGNKYGDNSQDCQESEDS